MSYVHGAVHKLQRVSWGFVLVLFASKCAAMHKCHVHVDSWDRVSPIGAVRRMGSRLKICSMAMSSGTFVPFVACVPIICGIYPA